ncbi:MAG: hypothetical protein R8L53_07565 [Mariprofundales bacterium]
MNNVEYIYHKAQTLDAFRLQELSDFLDFLLTKQGNTEEKHSHFPETQLESVDMTSLSDGKCLSIDEMNMAVQWEAAKHK